MNRKTNLVKDRPKLWASLGSILPELELEPEESLSKKVKSLPKMKVKFFNFRAKTDQSQKKTPSRKATKKTTGRSSRTYTSMKSPFFDYHKKLKVKNTPEPPHQCLSIKEKEPTEKNPSELSNNCILEENNSDHYLTSMKKEEEFDIQVDQFSLKALFRTNSSNFHKKHEDLLDYNHKNILHDRIFPKNPDHDQPEINGCKKIAKIKSLRAEIARKKNGGILKMKDDFLDLKLTKRKVSNVSFNKQVIVKKYNPRANASHNQLM